MQDSTAAMSTAPPDAATPVGGQGGLAEQLAAAAIGTSGAEHYRKAFARLDAAGRALPGWNGAAALAGPAWLAFRGLWRALAVVLVLWLGVAIAGGWAGEQALLPGAVLAGMALALWLGSALALGVWGDAWVHRDVRQRVEAAVTQAATMQAALQRLQSTAPTRRTMAVVAAVSVVAWVVLAWVVWRGWPQQGVAPRGQASEPGTVVVSGAVTPAPKAPTPPPEPVPAAPLPAPVEVPAFDEGEVQEVQGETDAALAALAASSPQAAAGKEPRTRTAAHPPAAAPVGKKKPTEHTKPAPSAAQAEPAAKVRQLYINVGIFADPENASRAHERLQKEGLPAHVDAIKSSGGKTLKRVRVGPFTSAAQANEAAGKVKLLGLDAVPAAQ